jgi:hypothetical protein
MIALTFLISIAAGHELALKRHRVLQFQEKVSPLGF